MEVPTRVPSDHCEPGLPVTHAIGDYWLKAPIQDTSSRLLGSMSRAKWDLGLGVSAGFPADRKKGRRVVKADVMNAAAQCLALSRKFRLVWRRSYAFDGAFDRGRKLRDRRRILRV